MVNQQWDMTQEEFDRLLAWLGPDREEAGRRYEEIRRRLLKIFTCRGCGDSDVLADETINRVTKKLPEIIDTYTGDPAYYFCGVAQKIYLEQLRRKPAVPAPPPPSEPGELERQYECLERCMERLTPNSRELVMQYYREDKQAKINHRKDLAQKLGIALNALRIRAFRIRSTLQQCVENCLEQQAA